MNRRTRRGYTLCPLALAILCAGAPLAAAQVNSARPGGNPPERLMLTQKQNVALGLRRLNQRVRALEERVRALEGHTHVLPLAWSRFDKSGVTHNGVLVPFVYKIPRTVGPAAHANGKALAPNRPAAQRPRRRRSSRTAPAPRRTRAARSSATRVQSLDRAVAGLTGRIGALESHTHVLPLAWSRFDKSGVTHNGVLVPFAYKSARFVGKSSPTTSR